MTVFNSFSHIHSEKIIDFLKLGENIPDIHFKKVITSAEDKLDNAFKEYSGEVSEETLIETDPDVLIVGDWSSIEGSVSGDEVIQALYKNPKLSSMKAIKNKKVYGVDYNYLFGYGYQSLTGLEKLVKEMK